MDLLMFLAICVLIMVHDEVVNGNLRKTLKDLEE